MKNKSVYIIGDIGVNHNGDFKIAVEMIKRAKDCGLDAVKFQFWGGEYYKSCDWRDVLDGLNFDTNQLLDLKEICDLSKIDFFITAFDQLSFDLIKMYIKTNIYKIPSNKYVLNNKSLLDDILQNAVSNNKKLFVSCGQYDFDNMNKLYNYANIWDLDLTLFHCVSLYPTPFEAANFSKLKLMLKTFPSIDIGLSDHSGSIELPIAAVAMGVASIEVHITIDKNQYGPDHKASLNFEELRNIVNKIRNVELAMNGA